ncbi:MAG: hypothetical protein J6Q78_06650 [Clostridia bacterium]|nr:hypothetical protein [Clostridia bacterium]
MRKAGSRSSSDLIKRILIRGSLILVLAAAECSFFSALKPMGATPDLILGLVVALALTSTLEETAVCAVVGGYVIDALGGIGLSFSALFYLLVGVSIGIMAKKIMQSFPAYAVLLIPAFLLGGIYTGVEVILFYGSVPTVSALVKLILPQMLMGYIFCLPIYFIVKVSSLPLESKGKFTFR